MTLAASICGIAYDAAKYIPALDVMSLGLSPGISRQQRVGWVVWTRAISGGFDVRPATQAEIAGAGEVPEGTVHRWVETLPAPFVESLGGAIGVISLV